MWDRQQEEMVKQRQELLSLQEELRNQQSSRQTESRPLETEKKYQLGSDESLAAPSSSLHTSSAEVSERKSSLLEDTAVLLQANPVVSVGHTHSSLYCLNSFNYTDISAGFQQLTVTKWRCQLLVSHSHEVGSRFGLADCKHEGSIQDHAKHVG